MNPNEFSSEKIVKMVKERISNEPKNSYAKVLEDFWETTEKIAPNIGFDGYQADSMNNFLEKYAQVIALESVKITLDSLAELGVLEKEED